jgi:hypothetical protein
MEKEKQIPFAQVPLSVLKDKNLSSLEKIVYSLVLGNSKLKGYYWGSNNTLAESAGCSERWIRQSLTKLEELNYIKRYSETKDMKTQRKIYPQIVVRGEELQFQSPRNYSSSNNNSSIKNYTRTKKPADFFSCEGKPTRCTGTEILKTDDVFKATNGTYDMDTFILECKERGGETKWRDTPLYKEVNKLLINK